MLRGGRKRIDWGERESGEWKGGREEGGEGGGEIRGVCFIMTYFPHRTTERSRQRQDGLSPSIRTAGRRRERGGRQEEEGEEAGRMSWREEVAR